jgi:hypothetical protein
MLEAGIFIFYVDGSRRSRVLFYPFVSGVSTEDD